MTVARVDLHCHTSASFDGVADPAALVRRAAERGLTHLAVTDHQTLDGARRAADAADAAHPGLVVIIGCETTTTDGDLVFLFLERPLPPNLTARDTIAAAREQGALVGIPHPFDHTRRSLLLDPAHEGLASMVDWIETMNGRVGHQAANDQAAALATKLGVPGIGVSDAHTLIEVGTVHTETTGDPGTPSGLLAAIRGPMTIVRAAPAAPPRGPLARLLHRGTGPVGSAR